MKNEYTVCLASSGGDEGYISELRDLLKTTALWPLLDGECVQLDIGRGGSPDDKHLFRRTAEEILEAVPNHPETDKHDPYLGGGRWGFRGVARRHLSHAENVVSMYVDYEPGQGIPGEPVQRDRFDHGVRDTKYRPAEVDLAVRCIGQARSVAYEMGLGNVKAGFYNLPGGRGETVNVGALREIHAACATDFVHANAFRTSGDVTKDIEDILSLVSLRRSQFPDKEVVLMLMPRDNRPDTNTDFPVNFIDPMLMLAKGFAVGQASTSFCFWVSASWIKNSERNREAIVNSANALATGIKLSRGPV